MGEQIRFHQSRLLGIDAMTAATARSFPRHTHDQFGLGVIDAGGHASLSDRGQVEAGPGNLIFVNPGEVHDGRAVRGQPRTWRILYFDPTVMQHLRADVSDRGSASFAFNAPVFADEPLRRLFLDAFARVTANARVRDLMECETAILRLIARVQVNSTARPDRPGNAEFPIRRARDLIDADPASQDLTLAALAAEVGLSRYQLLRAFARELGLTPHAYILQQRLASARRLIRAGQPLAEVAAFTGFFDQSHLTRCFTRQFGVTPRCYAGDRRQ
jgi:AraC-like DNA-binding protein